MTAEEFVRQLAWQIVEMEEEAGCVGMAADHLMTLIKDSIKAEPDNFSIARAVASELDQATQEKEDELTLNETFHGLVDELFSPDEEEAIYAGGEEQ